MKRAYIAAGMAVAAAVIFSLSAIPASGGSATYSIPTGQSVTINEWGTCYLIQNTTGKSLFVPTKTLAEWTSFFSKNIANITKTPCGCAAAQGCGAGNEGDTCTTFSATSATSPSLCSGLSLTSTCSGGSWSPSPSAYGSCTQNYRSCSASGACSATANGGTCSSYSASSVTSPSSCSSVSVSSTCNDGTWSTAPGSYGSCSVAYRSCSASGGCGATANGGSCTSYTSSSVTSPSSCSSVQRTSTCNDGTWSTAPGSYGSCSVSYRSCSASGGCGATANGGSCTSYSSGSVSYPSSCSSISSTCNDGTWSTTPGAYGSCSVSYSYNWSYGGWGSCSASCGSGTQYRSASCIRSDGATVADAYCGTPTTSQTCSSYSSCSYSWNYGGWGTCSASCGGGTQTRSASCVRSDGTAVSDSYCGTPTTSQSCNTQACYSYDWSAGSWSGCSASCGGTQTRTVYCRRSDGASVSDVYCFSIPPASSQSCNGNGTSCSACSGAGCNYGTCSGTSCTAQAPLYCWSSPGGCSYGTTNASGVCQASDPPYYGQSCTSSANSCGMTNSGTYNCSGTCSASTPSNSLCPVYGCTNSSAFNYNPSATTNDGSCHFNGCYDVDVDHYSIWINDVYMICSTHLYDGDYMGTVTKTCMGIGDCNYWSSQDRANVGSCQDAYSNPYYMDRILGVGYPYSCN